MINVCLLDHLTMVMDGELERIKEKVIIAQFNVFLWSICKSHSYRNFNLVLSKYSVWVLSRNFMHIVTYIFSHLLWISVTCTEQVQIVIDLVKLDDSIDSL